MIEIRHRTSGTVLLRVADESLAGKQLSGQTLVGADFSGRTMTYTCLARANLRGADFSQAVLTNAVLNDVRLDGATLRQADLGSANLLGADLRGADLGRAVLRYAQMAGANLQSANLEGADLSMADLRANFREANLAGADLRGANLTGANLQMANLTGADLTSANLAGAVLTGAKLQGAKIDRNKATSGQAVLSAPTLFTRLNDRSRPAELPVDFDRFGVRPLRKEKFHSQPDAELPKEPPQPEPRPAAERPSSAHADPLAKWKNRLRVRFLGGGGAKILTLAPGAEGVVVGFYATGGSDDWQVQFPGVGVVDVPKAHLEILDREFVRDTGQRASSEQEPLLESVKETVLYSTNRGTFKSLVVWYKDGRYIVIDEWNQANRLIGICKRRRIPVAQDRWFD